MGSYWNSQLEVRVRGCGEDASTSSCWGGIHIIHIIAPHHVELSSVALRALLQPGHPSMEAKVMVIARVRVSVRVWRGLESAAYSALWLGLGLEEGVVRARGRARYSPWELRARSLNIHVHTHASPWEGAG